MLRFLDSMKCECGHVLKDHTTWKTACICAAGNGCQCERFMPALEECGMTG